MSLSSRSAEFVSLFENPEDQTPELSRTAVVIGLLGFSVAILHIMQVLWFVFPTGQFKNLHLGLGLILCALALAEASKCRGRSAVKFWWCIALAVVVPLVYIHLAYHELIGIRAFLPSANDLAIASLLLVLTLVIAARQWGIVIPVVAIAALIYGYFGDLLPTEVLHHGGIKLDRLIGYTSIPYFRGLLGSLTEMSANMIFIFMLFAGVLKSMGGLDLVMRLAFGMASKSRAGPAQTAVLGSGFMGMISGSIMANVASTGAFTIPMMKRLGFSPRFAAAVEAVASTGGQVTPPTMGLAAFLIVGITGIAYVEIMTAAVFPAIIYFGYLLVAVHIYAVRNNIRAGQSELSTPSDMPFADVPMRRVLLLYAHLLVGLVALVWLLFLKIPAGVAATYSIFILIALEILKQVLLDAWHPHLALWRSFKIVFRGFVDGAVSAMQMAVVIAVLGILVEVFVTTGFAQKLSFMMLDFAREDFWLLLAASAAACLAFGLGMPTPAAYILVAIIGAPALIEFGVPVLAAHLYLFYFANMAAVTPPVGTGALVAAQIAQANFFSTCFVAMRLALPGFLLPVAFILHPEILGLDTHFTEQALYAFLALTALVCVNAAIEGALLRHLSLIERAAFLLAATGIGLSQVWSVVPACLIIAVLLALQLRGAKGSRIPDVTYD